MHEQFLRTEMVLGQPALERLQNAHVAVFGLGGVGSYAAEILARSGVGELTLVDQDTVSVTNINRQLCPPLHRGPVQGGGHRPPLPGHLPQRRHPPHLRHLRRRPSGGFLLRPI